MTDMTDHKSTSKKLLSQRQIKVLAFWTGDLVSAARAAGYKEPEQAAYRLMKNPLFVKTLQQKQESMAEESGKILGERIAVSRTEVLNRLWDLARMTPEQTNGTIYGQIKATETLAYVFDIKIVRPADVDDLLRGRTTDEVNYFVANGYFPEDALESRSRPPRPWPMSSISKSSARRTSTTCSAAGPPTKSTTSSPTDTSRKTRWNPRRNPQTKSDSRLTKDKIKTINLKHGGNGG